MFTIELQAISDLAFGQYVDPNIRVPLHQKAEMIKSSLILANKTQVEVLI